MKYDCYVRPRSQLGNVLFQYAFCSYYSLQHNMTPYMAVDGLLNRWWNDYSKSHLFNNGNIINSISKRYVTISPQKHSREYVTFDHVDDNIFFDGLFQSPKYWNNDKDFIFNLFGYDNNLIDEIKSLYNDIDFDNVISIHMRRTDFFVNMSQYINTVDYVYNIINTYLPDEKHFIILSDDLSWCRNNMKDERFIFADRSSSKYPKLLIDMFLMTLCKGNIINNISTFSWWGSYLNKNKDRKVYYSSKCGTTYDFIPDNDNWIDTKF